MEIQDFKSKWNGRPIELISAAEADVLVNLDREKEERLDYIRTKVAAIGWNVSAVVPVASGTYNRVRHIVVIGENTVGNFVHESTEVRSFAEFKNDHAAMMETLQRRVDQSDYVMGAIRALGFDVREDTAVEKVSAVTMAAVKTRVGVELVPAFANTSAAVYISLDEKDRNTRFVAVAGAGWYKVTFASR